MKEIFSPLEPIYVSDEYGNLRLPYVLRRMDKSGLRFYFEKTSRKVSYYLSVTSFCSISLPTSKHLIEWKVDLGEDAEVFTKEAADYGTVTHDKLLDFAVAGTIDMRAVRLELIEFLEFNEHPSTLLEPWLHRLEHDLIAWADFCEEHDVTVIAIEYPIHGGTKFKLGGSIDLVCKMRVKEWGNFGETYKRKTKDNEAGDPKLSKGWVYHNAVLDIKTGRKGFYESHELQINCYKKMWNTHFGSHINGAEPVFHVNKAYNWRPKDWRSKDSPSKFTLKDQTDSKFIKVIKDYYNIARKMEYLSPNLNRIVVDDVITRAFPINDQYNVLSHEAYFKAVSKGKISADRIL